MNCLLTAEEAVLPAVRHLCESILQNVKIINMINCLNHDMAYVSGYSLVAERAECLNTEYREVDNSLYSIYDCANACEEPATMFTFGTNDFDYYDSVSDENKCNEYGCRCYCWYGTDATTTCPIKDHIGYRLYKYNLVTKGNSFDNVVIEDLRR